MAMTKPNAILAAADQLLTQQYWLPATIERASQRQQQLLLSSNASTRTNNKYYATHCQQQQQQQIGNNNNNSQHQLTAASNARTRHQQLPQLAAAIKTCNNYNKQRAPQQQQQPYNNTKVAVAAATATTTTTTSPALKVCHRKNKCNSNNNNNNAALTTIAIKTASSSNSTTQVAARNALPRFVAATSRTKACRKTLALHCRKKPLAAAPVSPSATSASLSSYWPPTLFSTSASSSASRRHFHLLPSLGATSFLTILTLVCLETVLLSTVSNCAKTFYMHWNTSNSIFRIDNTDHIIDVNKGNLAFEFDQVHIICPVYEPGTYENETEKYIIYNVSKVEYETCRITNADPRVIAICDKPQKLMFFTITFRPFTPQPGGLEFLPGNDYYFISTSSKDDLYRRIGGRCSTNNMKVVFKVCCAAEEKNKTLSGGPLGGGGASSGVDNSAGDGSLDATHTTLQQQQHSKHHNNMNINTIGGVNTALLPAAGATGGGNSNGNVQRANNNGIQLNPLNGGGMMSGGGGTTSINTNIDQFNRIPMQTNNINVLSNNIGPGGGGGLGHHHLGGGNGGIMLTPSGGINMIPTGGIGGYPTSGGGGMGMGGGGQTGIRINNVPSQQYHPQHKNNYNNNNHNDDHYDKHPNEVVKNEELTYNSAGVSIHGRHKGGLGWAARHVLDWSWLWRHGGALWRCDGGDTPASCHHNNSDCGHHQACLSVSEYYEVQSISKHLTIFNFNNRFNTIDMLRHMVKQLAMHLNAMIVLSLLLIATLHTTTFKLNLPKLTVSSGRTPAPGKDPAFRRRQQQKQQQKAQANTGGGPLDNKPILGDTCGSSSRRVVRASSGSR